MLKRILYGSGAMGVLTAGYLLGSVSLSGAFAQTVPTPSPAAQAQTASTDKEQAEPNDQAESADLASQAKITTDQANTAALAQFPGGMVKKTELDRDNGTVVYSVSLTDSTGKHQDVKVDASSGTVLQAQAAVAHGPRTPGAPESGETAD